MLVLSAGAAAEEEEEEEAVEFTDVEAEEEEEEEEEEDEEEFDSLSSDVLLLNAWVARQAIASGVMPVLMPSTVRPFTNLCCSSWLVFSHFTIRRAREGG